MKIEIKFSNYQLSFLNATIADNLTTEVHGKLKEHKSFIYLMNDVSAKLLKKAIEKRQDSKSFKISFKYYEAFALHQFLYMFIDFEIIDFETTERRRVTREILGILNQKIT